MNVDMPATSADMLMNTTQFLAKLTFDLNMIARRVPWTEYREMQKIVETINAHLRDLKGTEI